MDMGAKDAWIERTRPCADFLKSVDTPGEFHIGEDLKNGHDGIFWTESLPKHLSFFSTVFSQVKR
jgi:hypothetical protein